MMMRCFRVLEAKTHGARERNLRTFIHTLTID